MVIKAWSIDVDKEAMTKEEGERMPKELFYEIDEEKKKRITEAALKEFAEYGFENASTNQIVKESGISKGSLFKYFESKEDLYFYLMDTVSLQMAEDMKTDIANLPADIFERVAVYSVAEISWYAANPVKGKFMIKIAAEGDSEIGKKIIKRYGEKSNDIYLELMKGADLSGLHAGRKEVTNLLKWVLQGFNESYLKNLNGEYADIGKLKRDYTRQLKKYLKILKDGL